jgi:hypothetical protein
MLRGIDMRFKGHETFFIRKGWLYKGLKNIRETPTLFTNKDINAMDVLGIGSNMVRSLRYWLQAVGLTTELMHGVKQQIPTDLANIIWDNDRYMEELGTLWLLHFILASNKDNATSWYFFFNEFNMNEFKKEDFVFQLSNYASIAGEQVAQTSLEDDFTCIINTYLSRNHANTLKDSPENTIDCPLGELGLIELINKKDKVYRKVSPKKNMVHPLILLSLILKQAAGRKEIKITELLRGENGLGKLLNLDIIDLSNYLDRIDRAGYIKVVRTAGLDVVNIMTDMSCNDCINEYYRMLML